MLTDQGKKPGGSCEALIYGFDERLSTRSRLDLVCFRASHTSLENRRSEWPSCADRPGRGSRTAGRTCTTPQWSPPGSTATRRRAGTSGRRARRMCRSLRGRAVEPCRGGPPDQVRPNGPLGSPTPHRLHRHRRHDPGSPRALRPSRAVRGSYGRARRVLQPTSPPADG